MFTIWYHHAEKWFSSSSIILKNIKIRKEDAPIMRAGGYNDDNDCVHGQSKQRIKTRFSYRSNSQAAEKCERPAICAVGYNDRVHVHYLWWTVRNTKQSAGCRGKHQRAPMRAGESYNDRVHEHSAHDDGQWKIYRALRRSRAESLRPCACACEYTINRDERWTVRKIGGREQRALKGS